MKEKIRIKEKYEKGRGEKIKEDGRKYHRNKENK